MSNLGGYSTSNFMELLWEHFFFFGGGAGYSGSNFVWVPHKKFFLGGGEGAEEVILSNSLWELFFGGGGVFSG